MRALELTKVEKSFKKRRGEEVRALDSVSLVGFGIVAAVMPLFPPEKGQQVTYIVSAILLLVSGVYRGGAAWIPANAVGDLAGDLRPRRISRRLARRSRDNRAVALPLAAHLDGRGLRPGGHPGLQGWRTLRQTHRQAQAQRVRRNFPRLYGVIRTWKRTPALRW